MTLFEFRS